MPGSARPYSVLPPVVKLLLIANLATFVMQMFFGGELLNTFALWPWGVSGSVVSRYSGPHFQVHQLITYAFLHGGLFHLFLNMYALWLFGARMENVWGSRSFAIYYLVCVMGAALVQLIVSALGNHYYPTVGASGGVFGLLLAFGVTFPREVLVLVFPPVALQARWFVTLYGAVELWFGVTGTAAGIAHFAHLGGMLFGMLLILYWRARSARLP